LAHDPHHDANRPSSVEPGPAGSHETALKNFLSVSELALDREMAATYNLGPFRLDAGTDTLFRGSEPVSLGHRAVALLRVLVEQRGIPVSKDALMEAAWAGLTVEESNLAVQIAALRRVFGEEPGGENWIETLPRRGYRFVGPASIRDQSAVAAASQAANLPVAGGSSNPTLPDRPSIAVLPFQNISADAEQEYFADGMADEIITALSRFPSLFVIARNSSFTYKGRAVDVKQVARELGVRYVLEGSVRKAGNRVRFTGQLIDATTGTNIWADRFDGALEDVFELQDQVTARVVGAIEPRLQRAEIERAGRKPTESLDAYDYFLRGMASFHLHTKDSLLEAVRLFVHATELDPNYASPYGMASWSGALRNSHGWMADRESEIADAVRLARRAVTLGKDDPTALWSGGLSLAYLAKEVEAGAAYIDRALVLNPNLAASWNASGWVRMYLGDYASAIEHFELATRLSPLDPLTYFASTGMAFAHAFAGRYDEAISWATKALHEQPNWATALRVAAMANALSDRMVEARATMACLREVDPALRLGNLDWVAPPLRRPEDRVRFIESLRKSGLPE
jgi:TolB-like protein/Flp pilus assembly protein TadD